MQSEVLMRVSSIKGSSSPQLSPSVNFIGICFVFCKKSFNYNLNIVYFINITLA